MKPRGYWTYEKCSDVVKKYKTKRDLYTKDKSAYVKITKMKWFDLLENLEVSTNDILKRLIYVYEFSDNSCYIGLTYNIKNRNRQHLESNKSPVFNHIKKTGIFPKLIVKTELIDVDKAILEEESILLFYKNNGWNILNIAKTGSTGGFSKINIDDCINEIKKYDKLSDFIKNSKNYYYYIIRHSLQKTNKSIKELIDNIRTFNEIGKFKNKEACKNESLKYKSRKDFQIGSKTAWNYSRINGWLGEFFNKND